MSDEKKKIKVSSTADLQLALAAGYEADQITIDHTDAIAAARAEGVAEGKASGGGDADAVRQQAAKDERARIQAIQGMARAGFDAELKAAIDSGDTPEKFAMTLLKAAGDRGITLEGIRRDAPPAAPHAKPGDASGSTRKLKSSSEIFAARRNARTTAASAQTP